MRRERIIEFNRAFNLPIAQEPTLIPEERWKLRIDLIQEELDELKEAYEKGDLIEQADALGDLDYLIQGGAVESGIKLDPVFKEIHNSNMSKLDSNGKPIYRNDGKVMKGENYFKPNIKAALKPSFYLTEEEYIHGYIQEVIQLVCDEHGLEVHSDIFSKSRVHYISQPRKIIFYLIRDKFIHFIKYGKILQGYFSMDRTTFINNSDSVANLMQVDEKYRNKINKLKNRLQ